MSLYLKTLIAFTNIIQISDTSNFKSVENLDKKIGVNDLMKKTLCRKSASETSIFMSARPVARKYRRDGAVTKT